MALHENYKNNYASEDNIQAAEPVFIQLLSDQLVYKDLLRDQKE